MLTYALGCIFLHCTFPIGLSGTSPNWVVHGMKETWSCCCTSAVFNQGRFDYKIFKNYIWRELRDIYNDFTFTISSEVYALWKPYISELKIWQNWMKLQERRFVYGSILSSLCLKRRHVHTYNEALLLAFWMNAWLDNLIVYHSLGQLQIHALTYQIARCR